MPNPSLSVVIPTYNNARYLPAAIASVRAQGPDTQVIVVDDGSTDETPGIADAMPDLTYVRQTRAGAAAARNRGLRDATGLFLSFLDADDYWPATKTARQRGYLDEHGVDMVFGHAQEFADDSDTAAAAEIAPPRPARVGGTMLIARTTFERVGEFSSRWRVGEFIEWYLRAVDLGLTAGMLPDVVLYRRLHATNAGRTAGAGRADYLHIIKQTLDRRRVARSTASRS